LKNIPIGIVVVLLFSEENITICLQILFYEASTKPIVLRSYEQDRQRKNGNKTKWNVSCCILPPFVIPEEFKLNYGIPVQMKNTGDCSVTV
jgi:hypothetical protein